MVWVLAMADTYAVWLFFVAVLILINSFTMKVEARLYLSLLGICKIKQDDLWHIIWHAVENG